MMPRPTRRHWHNIGESIIWIASLLLLARGVHQIALARSAGSGATTTSHMFVKASPPDSVNSASRALASLLRAGAAPGTGEKVDSVLEIVPAAPTPLRVAPVLRGIIVGPSSSAVVEAPAYGTLVLRLHEQNRGFVLRSVRVDTAVVFDGDTTWLLRVRSGGVQ
jgi:hypothetical protein